MKTIELSYPISVEGVEMKTLKLRRPKVRDQLSIEKAGGSSAEKEIRLFANLTEMPPEALEELDIKDYAKLQEAYQDFLS